MSRLSRSAPSHYRSAHGNGSPSQNISIHINIFQTMLKKIYISDLRLGSKAAIWFLSGWIIVACSTDTGEAVTRQASQGDTHTAGEDAVQAANQTADQTADQAVVADFPDENTLSEIHDLFSEYDREDAPGCAVAVYRNGETAYSATFGMANLDYGIPLSDSARFYMASVSKQVTAAAAGLLIVRGELGYDDMVSDHIDDWPGWASGVRVRHLFNHTSGLPDIYDIMDIAGISLSNVMDIDDYMALFINGESLKSRPGTAHSYTNSGYTTLAKLVEVISGKKFSEFVEEELLEPLGMTATHFHDDRTRVIPNRVISYAPLPGGRQEEDEDGGSSGDDAANPAPAFRQTYLSNFQGVGPGGLYSSLKDWKHWESFWLGNNELPSEFEQLKTLMSTREVVRNDTLNYALGLDVETWQGVRMMGHTGSFMGFKTDVRRFPDHGLSLLTLCNREDADPGDKNRNLAKILLRDVFEAFLMPYGGTYHNEELLIDYKLVVEEGSLKLIRRLSPNGVMSEDARDKWRAGSWDLVFQRDDEERITGFVVATGRAREVEFKKKD